MPVKDYSIVSTTVLQKDIHLFLLAVGDNVENINRTIIPTAQLEEILRYRFLRDSNKRLLARSFLYELMAEHCGLTDFTLGFNKFGKPYLLSARNFSFSFSYAKDYLMVALVPNKKIGVDIEFIDGAFEVNELAPEIMCHEELTYFQKQQHSEDRRRFFFQVFAGKESIIKAFGTGLSFPVKTLNILETVCFVYDQTEFHYHRLQPCINDYAIAVTYEAL